jgi:hypothetical protein
MIDYLARLRAIKSKQYSPDALPKLTKDSSDSFDSLHTGRISENNETSVFFDREYTGCVLKIDAHYDPEVMQDQGFLNERSITKIEKINSENNPSELLPKLPKGSDCDEKLVEKNWSQSSVDENGEKLFCACQRFATRGIQDFDYPYRRKWICQPCFDSLDDIPSPSNRKPARNRTKNQRSELARISHY